MRLILRFWSPPCNVTPTLPCTHSPQNRSLITEKWVGEHWDRNYPVQKRKIFAMYVTFLDLLHHQDRAYVFQLAILSDSQSLPGSEGSLRCLVLLGNISLPQTITSVGVERLRIVHETIDRVCGMRVNNNEILATPAPWNPIVAQEIMPVRSSHRPSTCQRHHLLSLNGNLVEIYQRRKSTR